MVNIDELKKITWTEEYDLKYSLRRITGYGGCMEVYHWCDETFGKDNWTVSGGKIFFKNAGSLSMFLLRWE